MPRTCSASPSCRVVPQSYGAIVASQPTLLHTGLGVLPAGSAPHHPIGMLPPWAAGLPCGLEPTPLLLGGRWVLPWPGCACFAYYLHREGDVHCTCGVHQMLACFACPHVRTRWLIANTAYAFEAMTALRAQGMNLVITIRASEDIPKVVCRHSRHIWGEKR